MNEEQQKYVIDTIDAMMGIFIERFDNPSEEFMGKWYSPMVSSVISSVLATIVNNWADSVIHSKNSKDEAMKRMLAVTFRKTNETLFIDNNEVLH